MAVAFSQPVKVIETLYEVVTMAVILEEGESEEIHLRVGVLQGSCLVLYCSSLSLRAQLVMLCVTQLEMLCAAQLLGD